MSSLAQSWKAQGRHSEALGLMRDCVRLRKRKLGANHPYFISSSNILATWEAEQAEFGVSAEEDMAQRHENLASHVE
jgi:hypothetical protein